MCAAIQCSGDGRNHRQKDRAINGLQPATGLTRSTIRASNWFVYCHMPPSLGLIVICVFEYLGYIACSVLPRPFLQGAAPCPFLVTPCLFLKTEMTSCLFCQKKKKKNYYYYFFVIKAGHHFIIMVMMMMMKWRPHNPGPRQLPP